jgi:hypothetical protein
MTLLVLASHPNMQPTLATAGLSSDMRYCTVCCVAWAACLEVTCISCALAAQRGTMQCGTVYCLHARDTTFSLAGHSSAGMLSTLILAAYCVPVRVRDVVLSQYAAEYAGPGRRADGPVTC